MRSLPGAPIPDASTKIRDRRLALGWSQEELAAKVQYTEKDGRVRNGVTRQTVARWETDENQLTLDKLRAVAAAMALTIFDLLPEQPPSRLEPEVQRVVDWWLSAADHERAVVEALMLGRRALNEAKGGAFSAKPAPEKRA